MTARFLQLAALWAVIDRPYKRSRRWYKVAIPAAYSDVKLRFIIVLVFSAFRLIDAATLWAGPHTWTSIGPDGGFINALAIDPHSSKTIYAATVGGISKSTDGGERWKPLSFPSNGVSGFAIDPVIPGTVYAGTLTGVFKTMDGGASWSRPQMTIQVSSLAIDPRNPGTVFAIGVVKGIRTLIKSTDGGTTWSAAIEPAATTLSLAIDPLNPRTVYAGTVSGLLKSTDGGTNWRLTGAFVANSIAIDPQDPSTLYANDSARGLLKSTDDGINWTPVGSGLNSFAACLLIDPQNKGTVYAGTNRGVFKTTDGGRSWTPANSGLAPTTVRFLAIDPQNPATVYAVIASYDASEISTSGVFKSTNRGSTWTASNSGLAATFVPALAIDPGDAGAIYAISFGTIFKKANGEASWTRGGQLAGWASSLAIHPQDSNTLYASAHNSDLGRGGLFKTTDRGASWNAIDSGIPKSASFTPFIDAFSVAIHPQDPNTLFAGITNFQNAGVYKSTDGGGNWIAAGSGLPKSWFAVSSFVFDPQSLDTVYAVLYDEWDEDAANVNIGIYKTTDSGATWNAVNDGLPPSRWGYVWVTALTIDPKSPTTLYAGTSEGVFKSINGGASWTAANSELRENIITSLAIDPLHPSTVYAGTWSRGVFKSTDSGLTWNAANSGLTTLNVQTLAIDPKDSNHVYAGTDGGGVFAIIFLPDLVVTDLRFDRPSVVAGGSFVVNISGPQLTAETFFDVRFTTPESNESVVVLNWQKGISAGHAVPIGTAAGIWTITGVRAHEDESDDTGAFFPVPATVRVIP